MKGSAPLELIGELVGLLELEEFRAGLLRAVREAVPADWVSLNDLGPAPADTVVLIDPPFPAEAHALYARHAFENPLLARYERTQDGRVYRFSDVSTRAQLHDTALYREFYASIGLEHQIAFTLPAAPSRVLALALSRKHRNFTDAERDLLAEARPYLIQIYRNAVEHTRLLGEAQTRAHRRPLPLEDPALEAALSARSVTPRQVQTLSWLATGRSSRAIAEAMDVSERTVHKHLQTAFAKLGVHSRAHAVERLWSFVADGRG